MQSLDHVSYQVHALIESHPFISDWRLMINVYLSNDLNAFQCKVLMNALYYSVMELLKNQIPIYNPVIEVIYVVPKSLPFC